MRASIKGTSQGRIAIGVRSTESLATRASTKSTTPGGGWRRPIITCMAHMDWVWNGSEVS